MIDRALLPSIGSVLRSLGIEPGRNRSRCPVHRGDNPAALSFNDETGVWFCFRCGFGGDAIELVHRSMDVDFRAALRFLGVNTSGSLPVRPDPYLGRRERLNRGLRLWAERVSRQLRNEFYYRNKIRIAAIERLGADGEESLGWKLLAIAYDGLPLNYLESLIDMVDGLPASQLAALHELKSLEGLCGPNR